MVSQHTDQHPLRWNKMGFLYCVADDDTLVRAQSMVTKFFLVSTVLPDYIFIWPVDLPDSGFV